MKIYACGEVRACRIVAAFHGSRKDLFMLKPAEWVKGREGKKRVFCSLEDRE